MNARTTDMSIGRREFLKVSLTTSGALLLVPALVHDALAADAPPTGPANPLGVYVRIEPDNRVVIGARCPEIGQGVKTSLPMILAEELDVAWAQVVVEQLPLGVIIKAGSPPAWKWGPQGAGGSTSISTAWADLRQVGAQGRWLMRAAAAKRWNSNIADMRTEAGFVVHGERRASYGELVAEAVALQLPSEPLPLKSPSEHRIVGRPQRVVDAAEIDTGRARYGLDVREPGALVAVIARCS
jgi:isoquinoline 1-oxidoreductase beta subunit